jgi:hypothetical protein
MDRSGNQRLLVVLKFYKYWQSASYYLLITSPRPNAAKRQISGGHWQKEKNSREIIKFDVGWHISAATKNPKKKALISLREFIFWKSSDH